MSLPRYAEYKESGVPWLGEVPAHWVPLKVKAFTQFCGGGTPSRENLAFWNGDIPWVSPKDMKVERIEGAEERITDEGLSNSSSSLVDSGRLLMVVRSGILKHTIPVAINDVPVALNQDMKALRFKEQSTTSEFFLRWVQGLNNALLLAWAKQGATVESIEHNYLAETLVPLPPLSEQSAIAAFLDRETGKIDALIAEQEKLLTLLAEKRQATISHAVTRGLNPNAPMKDSGVPWLGEVPSHWKLPPLYLRYTVELGKMLDTNKITGEHLTPYLRNMDVQWDRINTEDLPCMDISPNETSRFTVRDGDLLVCEGGEVGRAAVVAGLTATIGYQKALHRLRSLGEDESPRYLFFVFRWAASTGAFSGEGQSTIAHLTGEQLRKYRFPKPPLEEQQSIAAFLDAKLRGLDSLQAEAEQMVSLLKERRSALIAAAVTGKIDVRQAA
jgi:type I restriction enzyme S subunit